VYANNPQVTAHARFSSVGVEGSATARVNVLLDGRKPYDVLRENPLAVRDAARGFYRDEAST
jgi:hypothetical protein